MLRNPTIRGRFNFNIPQALPDAPTISVDEAFASAAPPVVIAPTATRQKTRKERRRDKVFNRQLERRLAKDDVPVKVEILPDGGLHVTADMREKKE